MTRAAAARAAAELADTAPGSILEGASEDEDMADGPLPGPDAPTNLVCSHCLSLTLPSKAAAWSSFVHGHHHCKCRLLKKQIMS